MWLCENGLLIFNNQMWQATSVFLICSPWCALSKTAISTTLFVIKIKLYKNAYIELICDTFYASRMHAV